MRRKSRKATSRNGWQQVCTHLGQRVNPNRLFALQYIQVFNNKRPDKPIIVGPCESLIDGVLIMSAHMRPKEGGISKYLDRKVFILCKYHEIVLMPTPLYHKYRKANSSVRTIRK